jgi:hypothetical protein
VADSLRPLDEPDEVRIGAWKTVDELRPKVKPRSGPSAPQSLAEFMEQNDYSDSGDEGGGESGNETQSTLALRGVGETTLAVAARGGSKVAWAARSQAYATVVIASTGATPELTYIRCHREQRRHLLLTRRLREDTGTASALVKAVQIAAQMARDGSLPAPGGRRTSEFMKRCAEAARAVSPEAETDASKLPREEQEAVRRALGNEKEPYQGCLSEECLDEDTVWVTEELGGLSYSRCARCKMLKAMGRTISTPLSIIENRLKLERGVSLRRSLAEHSELPFTRDVRRRTE